MRRQKRTSGAATAPRGSQRWYVWPEGRARAFGPFDALEVAHKIYAGKLGPRDVVIDAASRERRAVSEHPSLARWLARDEETGRRLYRAALRRARASAASSGRPTWACMPPWAGELLSEEQRRAFALLDLDVAAGRAEVRARYRELARRCHPDVGGDVRRMAAINRAVRDLAPLVAS